MFRAIREERESERSQIFQKNIVWRNAGAEERKVTGSSLGKGPIESDMILDGSDIIPGYVPVQWTQVGS